MLVSLTVGKVDAGVAVLLTEDKRLIEFPSILLPPDISSGSIVDITVARNFASEAATQDAFSRLQDEIYTTFGQRSPSPPVLRCRNATQTSIVLEWDPIQLATAELRSLSLYRNGSKAGNIPRPMEMQSTKISGLAVDTEYTFHLVLRTSAGVYSSEKLTVRTHKMTDLSGITITPGILPNQLKESLEKAVNRIGAKIIDSVRIDTTHFVCTEGRGQAWEKAVEMNIPVVRPEWVEGCEREGRIVGVRAYYLNADPRTRQVGPGVAVQQQQQQTQHHDAPPTPQPQERPTSQPSAPPALVNSREEAPLPTPPAEEEATEPNGFVETPTPTPTELSKKDDMRIEGDAQKARPDSRNDSPPKTDPPEKNLPERKRGTEVPEQDGDGEGFSEVDL